MSDIHRDRCAGTLVYIAAILLTEVLVFNDMTGMGHIGPEMHASNSELIIRLAVVCEFEKVPSHR